MDLSSGTASSSAPGGRSSFPLSGTSPNPTEVPSTSIQSLIAIVPVADLADLVVIAILILVVVVVIPATSVGMIASAILCPTVLLDVHDPQMNGVTGILTCREKCTSEGIVPILEVAES